MDGRLFAAFEERERERELFGPKKRGPKPETFLLKARAKEKQYDFRREAPRVIQVSYPVPEHVVTPRAREGLRTVVPTIFPPSAVNRGESVHVHALEPERRPRAVTPAAGQQPKKRGRKPKLRMCYDEGDGGAGSEPYGKRSRLQEEAPRPHHHHHPHHHHPHLHHHHQHGETSDHSLIQLTKRFEEKTTITPRSCGEQEEEELEEEEEEEDEEEEEEGSSHRWRSRQRPHRTSSGTESRKPRPRQQEPRVMQEDSEGPDDVSSRSAHDPPSPSWTPCLSNMDAVTVTDVTMNLLTVTVRESSTDKGFFRGKR